MLWTLLPVAIVLAAVAYGVLSVRRVQREHRARSDERTALLLAAMHGRNPGTPAAEPEAAAAAPPERAPGADEDSLAAATEAPSLAALRRPRVLTDPQRLLYLVLRAALPDYIIMANTRVIDLLDVAPGPEAVEHDARLRELLHQRLDCVVCRHDLVPLVAIVVHAAAMPRAPEEHKHAESLRELGIKFLRFRADSLPRPAEMRTLVLQ